MLGSTLNRMIFWELTRVFLMSLGTLTALFLIAGLVDQASKQGLSLSQIIRIIPLLIPSTLPLTIPATTLFASCVVYGRLAHDNEVIALKAAGVHLFGLAWPAVLLGIVTTSISAALYYSVIPSTQKQLYEEVLSDPEEVLYNTLRRDRCLRHPTMPYVLYVRDVQGKRLIDAVIKRRIPKTESDGVTQYDYVARMNEAQLRVDMDTGQILIETDRVLIHEKNISWTQYNPPPYSMVLPDSVSGKEARHKISTLTWEEIPRRLADAEAERNALLQQQVNYQSDFQNISDANLRNLAQTELKHFKYQIDMKSRQVRNLRAEVHARPALAFSCLVFALIGCPVGIWANRADYLSTFIICFLPTLVLYYPLLLAGTDLGKNGRVPLALGCWMANIIMGGIGLLLSWKLLRR